MYPLPFLVVQFESSIALKDESEGWIVPGLEHVYEFAPRDVDLRRCLHFTRVEGGLRLQWQGEDISPRSEALTVNAAQHIAELALTMTYVVAGAITMIHIKGQDEVEIPMTSGIIGRSSESTVRLLHTRVSRRQAEYTVTHPERVRISELPEATNKMTVGGKPTSVFELTFESLPIVIAGVTVSLRAGVELAAPTAEA